MTQGRASSSSLDALHALLAEAQAEELRRNLARARLPKRVVDPADPNKTIANPEYEPLSPKLLAVAIKFLKDNGVDTAETSPRFNDLVEQLNELQVDDPAFLTN